MWPRSEKSQWDKNATATHTLQKALQRHITLQDQDNTRQTSFVIIIIPAPSAHWWLHLACISFVYKITPADWFTVD